MAPVPHLHQQLSPLRSGEGAVETTEPAGARLEQHLFDACEVVVVAALANAGDGEFARGLAGPTIVIAARLFEGEQAVLFAVVAFRR